MLLPLLSLVLEGSQAAKAAGSAAAYGADMLSAEAKRGAAWVLLGAARLHLASPPPGADPAAKYSHKRVHLLAVLDDVLAELEVGTLAAADPETQLIAVYVLLSLCTKFVPEGSHALFTCRMLL